MEILFQLVVTATIVTVLKCDSIREIEKYWIRPMSPITETCLTVGSWTLLWVPVSDFAAQCWKHSPRLPSMLVLFPGFPFYFQDFLNWYVFYFFYFNFQFLNSFIYFLQLFFCWFLSLFLWVYQFPAIVCASCFLSRDLLISYNCLWLSEFI